MKDIKAEYIKTVFINVNDSFLNELNKYKELDKISGAISLDSKINSNKIKEIVFAKGKNIKEQINYALNEGLKKENIVEFHFKINKNFFFEIAKLRAFKFFGMKKKDTLHLLMYQ